MNQFLCLKCSVITLETIRTNAQLHAKTSTVSCTYIITLVGELNCIDFNSDAKNYFDLDKVPKKLIKKN
jgi:hypothetical protein